jgi:tetratricopeptide (TPR) repeat protein
MLKRLSFVIVTTIIWQFCSSLTLAQTAKPKLPDKFPPNPLGITIPDPLLPRSSGLNKRSLEKLQLTPQERQQLEVALDQLNQEATAQWQGGNKEQAFDIWNREVRLRRFLGSLSEVQALSRVGAIAWSDNNRQQVTYITQRLQAIQKQAKSQKTTDIELWRSLGLAYQQVRSPKPAVEAYEQVLVEVRQQKDVVAELEALKTIAEVHMSWFDYPSSAMAYEQLLGLASAKGDTSSELAYLQQLAYIYEQLKQPQNSINIRTKIAEIYQKTNNLIQLPELKIAIASDYEALAKENPSFLQEAFKNYQEAYTIAWGQQQFVGAGEALQKLVALYRSQGQLEEALQTSRILVQAQEKAANFYGLMKAYDQIGQISLERKDRNQALTAFQKGLEVAQQLKHEEAYFSQQIEQLSKANF